nr:GNAT family N-acetyltransferase [Eikenella glucosivorans]
MTVAWEGGRPLAFMGAAGGRLEMLFVSPERRGQGIGKTLLAHGIRAYGVRELTVNEQNPQAAGFYTHAGFRTYKRTAADEQGRPYPLLYMRLHAAGGDAPIR